MGRLLPVCLLFCLQLEASPKFSIVWATETHSGASNFLKDANGNALNAGNTLNGDGDLVEIGYFSDGSFAVPFQENAFKGNWIPLTLNARVGDSSSVMDSQMVCSPSRPHLQKIPIM